jgi:hypothetical protein
MSRPRYRVQLESGLKLDINRLTRNMCLALGSKWSTCMTWTNNLTGEEVASARIVFDIGDELRGTCEVRLSDRVQYLTLQARPRHFGGRQWYFICPMTRRRSSVLWMPPRARTFGPRQRWGCQVAYGTQFLGHTDRAHRGKAKINTRLCSLGGFNPDEWDLAPKPKWMRWTTYSRAEEKFDHYEEVLDGRLVAVAVRLITRMR